MSFRAGKIRLTTRRFALAAWLVAALLSPVILAQAPPVAAPDQPPQTATKVRVLPEDEPTQTPAVAVSPAATPIAPGAVHRFNAVVTGTPNQQITWTATGGTISSDGTFTAGSTPGTYLVTGTITGGTIYSSQLIVVAGARGASSYLSDRIWTSAINGWGPVEKDRSNGDLAAGDGLPLTLNAITYAKGLGTHAGSDLRFALSSACSTFTAVAGVDDEAGANGSVIFQVWTDGVKRYDSGVMTGAMPGAAVNVDVTGTFELALIVNDAGNGAEFDHADWADARVTCATDTTFLSDRTWTSMTNGWGPVEKDRSNGELGAADGLPLSVNGRSYTKGLGAHAPSDLRYALNNTCSVLTATVGLDDEVGSAGSVVFQVWTDGVKRYDSGIVTGAMPGVNVNVSVAGATELALILTDGGNGNNSDHGDWANAQLVCSADATAPTITTVTPANGTTGAALTADVTAVFSEPMTATTLTSQSVTLLAQGSSTPVAATVTYTATTNTVTLHPTTRLTATTLYTATIKSGAAGAKDAGGGAMAADRIWTFTTIAPADTTPPTITAVSPAAGTNGVAVAANVTATFSEALTASTLTPATVMLVPQGSTAPVAATVTYTAASNTVTLDPTPTLAGTTIYTATIKGGSAGAKDVAGNPLATDRIWTFTTTAPPDTTAPTITAVSPAAGTTGAALAVNVTATFSEALTASTLTAATVMLVPQGSTIPVAATITYAAASNTVTLDPTPTLAGTTVYTATIKGGSAGAKDAAGNPLATDRIWTFTTTAPPDTTAPTITAVSPAAGTTGAALAVNVTATFSEALTASTLTAATVLLVPQGSTTPVAATITYTAASNTVTLDPTPTLAGTTVYTATIKGGTAGVKDLSGNPLAADRVWTFSTGSAETMSYLSDRPWSYMTNGWGGVERDRSNGENATGDGATLTLNGVTYAKGLGAHAPSEIRYALNGTCSVFSAMVGVDDEASGGSVVFQVWTDGVKQYDSGVMTGAMAGKSVNVTLTGASDLTLIVTNGGDDAASDHGDWANAQVSCRPDITAPTLTGLAPAAGATTVATNATVSGIFSEAMDPATLTPATVMMVPQGSTTVVPATITYDGANKTVSLNHTGALAGSAIYVATIKGGVSGAKDLAGIPLAADRTWTFTTGAASELVTVSPANVSIVKGATQQFTAIVTTTGSPSVVWTAAGGTITTTGLYTAGPTNGTYLVRAASSGGTTGTAQVQVISDTTTAGPTGTAIAPGQDIQAMVNAAPAGTAFVLKAGIHRNQTINPKNNDSFTGETGTILSGGRVLTTPLGSGPWYYTGQTQEGGGAIGVCETGWTRCVSPEELFIDNVRMRSVGSLGEVGAGKWFFDYPADRIYIGDNPAGHAVETSVTTKAFNPTGTGVTITGLIVEKFAGPAQTGAIDCGEGCRVTNNEIRFNHGMGIRPNTNAVITTNNIHHNGHLGLGGGGIWAEEGHQADKRVGYDILIANNEIAFNNGAHFDFFWEAGGMKLVNTDRAIVRGNYSHDNQGPGLWTDIDNANVLYENNNVVDNAGVGIFHEIGWGAIIRNNTISRNGWAAAFYVYGAGILVSESSNVEVYGNTLDRNYDGICGLYAERGGTLAVDGGRGRWELRNLNVHDNDVTMLNVVTGEQTSYNGIVTVSFPEVFTTMGNVFKNNHYHIPNPAVGPIYGNFFAWSNAARSFTSWQGLGQETTGTVVSY